MQVTYRVTYSPTKGDPSVAIAPVLSGMSAPAAVPFSYLVTVDRWPETTRQDESRMAMSQAAQLHQAELAYLAMTPAARLEMERKETASAVLTVDEVMPYFRRLRRDAIGIAGRAMRWDLVHQGTASTDCRTYVTFNPEPYLNGFIEAGNGRGFHEAGHVAFDHLLGPELLTKAHEEDGVLGQILNLVMDRRTDDLNVAKNPGFALALRRRIGHLFPGAAGKNGTIASVRTSVYDDFSYACKKKTRPRHAVVRKCVQLVHRAIGRVNREKDPYPYGHLLVVSRQVKALLDAHLSPDEKEQKKEREAFQRFVEKLEKLIHGGKASQRMQQAFRAAVAQMLQVERVQAMQGLPIQVQALRGASGPSRGTGGTNPDPRVVKVPLNPTAYATSLARVARHVPRMRQVLEELSEPVTRERKGLESGDLDFDELATLVVGGRDCMMQSEEAEELDVAIAFLLDLSGSMESHTETIDLGTLLNEACLEFLSHVDLRVWGFNEKAFDCGPAARGNGIAGLRCDGGTDETFGLRTAGESLLGLDRRFKAVITVCDGGPMDPKAVEKVCADLMRQGILPIRLLVGVDVTPKTYPVELLFPSFDAVFQELSVLFRQLLAASRS